MAPPLVECVLSSIRQKKRFADVLDRAAFFKVHSLKDATEAKLIVQMRWEK